MSEWKDAKALTGRRWNLVQRGDAIKAEGNVEIHSMLGMENPNRDVSSGGGHAFSYKK